MLRDYRWITLIAGALAACGTARAPAALRPEAGDTCPVTRAPQPAFVPPAPYPSQPPPAYVGQFWYGTSDLWTMLEEDGAAWRGFPQGGEGYSQKVFWWSASFHAQTESKPHLTVTGRRLDGAAGPLGASAATNAVADFGEAMLVGVTVPTIGCWEITGSYRGLALSFVVRVEP